MNTERGDAQSGTQQVTVVPQGTGSSGSGTSTASVSGASFLIRSELMQEYTTARAIGSTPYLASAVDGDGRLQVFSLNDDGDLFNLFPAPKIATGWGVRPLGDAPTEITQFTVGTEIDGTLIMLACGSDSRIYWKSDEPWSGWTELGMPFGVMAVSALRTGYDRDGSVIFQAIAQWEEQYIVVRIYPRQAENPWDYVSPYIAGEIYDCVPGAGAEGAGAFVSSNDIWKANTNVTFYRDHQVQGRCVYANDLDDMVALCGVRDAGGSTQLFALSEQKQAFYVDQLAEPANLVSFNTDALGNELGYACIRASRFNTAVDGGADLPLQFFGLTSDGALYYSRQQFPVPDGSGAGDAGDGSSSLGWAPLVQLGDRLQGSSQGLTLCRDAQGYTHCFAVDSDGGLVHFWQDSTSDWKLEPIVIDFEGELREVPSYSTEVSVLDGTGNPVPGQLLQLGASEYMDVTINGVSEAIGPDRNAVCSTNASGRITVVTPTSTLGVPSFRVSASFLPDGSLVIAPDRYIQDYLYPPTAEDLQQTLSSATYTDPQGNQQPLIDTDTYGEYLPAASSAIWQSMSLAQPEEGDTEAAARVVSRRGDTAGVAVLPLGEAGGRIDLGKVKAQFWHIQFLDEGIRFHVLRDHAHYLELVEALAAGAPIPETGLGIDLLQPDWGTLWHSVRRGAAELKDVAVAAFNTLETTAGTIVTRIEATIQAAVDGLTQVFTYVVDRIQQVFDVVQSVLDALAADFEKLFLWLGSLFDWQAILQAHRSIKQILNQAFYQQIPDTLGEIQGKVDDFFDRFSTDGIDTGSFGNVSLAAGYGDAMSQAPKAPGPSSNWLENQVINAGGGNPAATPDTTRATDTDRLATFEQTVIDEFGDLYDTLIVQLQTAIAEGRSAGEITPNQAIALAARMVEQDLLAAAKTVTDVAFDLADFVVGTAGDMANASWHIPLVSKLYKQEVGDDMSLLDLTALALAIPTTIAAKAAGMNLAALDKAAQQVVLLNRHLTPAQLLGREAVDEATLMRLRAAGFAMDSATQQEISQALGLVYSFGLVIYSPFSWLYGVDEIKNKWVKAIPVVLSLAVLALSFPLFSGLPTTTYDWITIGCWAVAFLLWFSCSALPAVPGFLPARPLDPERQPLLPKNLGATTKVLDYVTGSLSLVGGVFLLVGYVAQAVVEGLDSSYLPDASPEFKTGDLTLKAVQNCLGVLPTVAQPLKWDLFDEYGGKAILGAVSVLGFAGAGAVGLVRDSLNYDAGQFNHVI